MNTPQIDQAPAAQGRPTAEPVVPLGAHQQPFASQGLRARLADLLSDAAVYGASSMLGRFTSFLLLPIYTYYLKPDDNGIVAMLTIVALIFVPAANLGMTNSIFRRFNLCTDDESRRKVLGTGLTSVSIVSLVFMVVSMFFAGPLAEWVVGDAATVDLVRLSLVWAAVTAIGAVPRASLRAVRRVRTIAALNLMQVLFTIVPTIWLFVAGQGVRAVIVGNVIGEVASALAGFYCTRGAYAMRLDLPTWRPMLRYGLPFVPHHIQAVMLGLFGQFVLRQLVGLGEAGIYNAAVKVAMPVAFIVNSINSSWVPYKYQVSGQANAKPFFSSAFVYYLAGLSYLWLGVSLWGPEAVRLMMQPSYHGATALVWAVALIPVAQGLYYMLGTGIEVGDQTSRYPILSLAGLIVAVVASYQLVPIAGALGAALATALAYLVMCGAVYYFAQRRYTISYDWPPMLALAAVAALFATVGQWVQTAPVLVRLATAIGLSIAYPAIVFVLLLRSRDERIRMLRLWQRWRPDWRRNPDRHEFTASEVVVKRAGDPPSHVPAAPTDLFGQTALLDWIDKVREAAEHEPWAELVDFEGINAFDVLASPIYLSLLNAKRGMPVRIAGPAQRMRLWAYQLRSSLRERIAARQSASPEHTDILFWSRHPTHTAVMQPVAAALRASGDRCRMMACKPHIFSELLRDAPDALYTMGAWPAEVHAARREGARRARLLARFGPWKLPPPPGGADPCVETALRTTVIEFLPWVSEAVANARAALDTFRPKVLVVGNDLTLVGRAGCRVAALRGVPTAVFMHGSVHADALRTRHCANRLLVFSEGQRHVLEQHGIAPERIAICGTPHLDQRPRQTGRANALVQARFGLQSGEPWILVLTSGPGHHVSYGHHQVVIDQLAGLSRALPEVPIVVKLHRKDHVNYYRDALKRCAGTRFAVVRHGSRGLPDRTEDWLQGCSLVLTGASTAATEAMLMDVPVISMDFCNELHNIDFIDAGATIHVTSGEALLDAVREVVFGPGVSDELEANVRRYLKDAFYALDGRSSQRGAEALKAMYA